MGHCPECERQIDELAVSDTAISSGVVYECPHCAAILGVSDAIDL